MDSSVEFDECFWVFLNYFSYFSFYFASILGKWDIPGLISSVAMTTVPKAACSTQLKSKVAAQHAKQDV